MGEVILIPPMVTLDRPTANTTDMQEFRAYFTDNTNPPKASVFIPKQKFDVHIVDPMSGVSEFHRLNAISTSSITRRRKEDTIPSLIARTKFKHDIEHMVWDHHEIVEAVAPWHGNLLIQIANTQWTFCITDNRDFDSFNELMQRRRKHRFVVPGALQKQIIDWLNDQPTDYDYFHSSAHNIDGNDFVYVKDDRVAVHFKLRWYGRTAESEMVN